ncbi:MAG: flippase-like domain-containing protein [Deltaproteobacteria bacterium]|nr:flippase-like domain-containing protein [Deltaproteobacteria bacterium]
MRPALRRALTTLALLALGLALLAGTVAVFGTEEVAETLAGADRRLLGMAALVFFTQFFTMGFRWWLTLRLLGVKVRVIPLFRANAASNFVNFFAPGHFGEPLMATWLGQSGRAPGVVAFSALIGSKVVATILSFAVLVACIPLLAARAEASWLFQVAATAVAIVLGTVVALVILLRPAVAAWGAALAGRSIRAVVGFAKPELGDKLAGSVSSLLLKVRDALATFASHPKAMLGSAVVSAVKISLQIVFVVLLFGAFDTDLTVAGATFLVTVDVLQNAISIWIPANLGVQEAMLTAAAAGGLAIDGSIAASAAVAHKAILLIHVGLGGVAFVVLGWLERLLEPASPADEAEAPAPKEVRGSGSRTHPSRSPSSPADAPP